MTDRRRLYSGTRVDVSYDRTRCRHAAECVRGLPAVFDSTRRPWILPDGADAATVVEVVARCPTGALRTHPKDVAPEHRPAVTSVELVPGGPLLLHGDLQVNGEHETRAALCACGSTTAAPYCDGSGTCRDWPTAHAESTDG